MDYKLQDLIDIPKIQEMLNRLNAETKVRERLKQLEEINTALVAEVVKRKKAEEDIKLINIDLEDRILQQTSRLEKINSVLEEKITEHKQVAQDLRDVEDRLSLISKESDSFFNVYVDMLAIEDFDGYFRRLNPSWEKTLGYTNNELMTKKFIDFIHPDDVGRTLEVMAILYSQKEVVHFLNRYRCKDGTYRWLEWDSVPAGNLIYAAARDITERKQAEENLAESLKSLSVLYEVYQQTTKELDANKIIRETLQILQKYLEVDGVDCFLVNDSCETIELHSYLGVPEEFAEKFRRLKIDDCITGVAILEGEPQYFRVKDAPELNNVRESALKYEITDLYCYPLVVGRKSIGTINIYNKSDRHIPEKEQELLRAVCGQISTALIKAKLFLSLSDELEQHKRTEEQLRKAKDEADRANAAKSQFLANMSHEIRTPMNGIIGMTDLTLMTDLTEDQRENLTIVKSSIGSLLRVLNDILDYSKIEAGKIDLEKYPFILKEIIQEVINLFDISAKQKGITMKLSIDPRVPEELVGDTVRIRQVLSNLVGNAVKFTFTGEIAINVTYVDSSADIVKLKFSVLDTGIGIAEDKNDKLFKSFSQVDDLMTRQFGGSGLGLAISKGLVERMGGNIWMESIEGVGSQFYFTAIFGLARDKIKVFEDGMGRDQNLQNDHLPSKLVLVAEDDEVSRNLVVILLKKKGLKVITAENGQKAVELYDQEACDLILMDVNMPCLDGFSATGIIRAKEKHTNRHTPIIAMTAYALKGDREKCLESGMDDYISKPIDINKLYVIVDNWL